MVEARVLQNSLAGDLFHVPGRLIYTTGFIKKKYRLGPVLLLVRCYLAAAFLVSLQAAGCFEFFDSVDFFPGEVGVFAAEVTVGCRLFVDGATQV